MPRSRKKPDLSDVPKADAFVTDLMGMETKDAPDRVVVIVLAAYLEEQLDRLLRGFLIDERAEGGGQKGEEIAVDTLLNPPDGAVSTFSAKARLAYCLGLLNREWYKDLKTIGIIRNAFAHHFDDISFADQWVADRCREMKVPKMAGQTEWPTEPLATNIRQLFTLSVYFLAIWLPTGFQELHSLSDDFGFGEPVPQEEMAWRKVHYGQRTILRRAWIWENDESGSRPLTIEDARDEPK